MPPSFGNLHVAAMLIGVGLILQRIWPHAVIEMTHLVSPMHLGWVWVQAIMPLWLFANAFAIRSIRRIHLKPFIGTFAICSTILIPACIAGVVRMVSYWAGDNLPWLSCAMFGTIVAIPDPRASRDFANYVSSHRELGNEIGMESCLIACGAVSIFTALQTFSGVQALPARMALTEGVSIVSGVALGALGALCAFLMIQQVPSRVIILTIALALGLVTLAAFLRADPAITATTAGLLLRLLMQRAGIVEDESLPGALFWDVLDMIWSCIAVVILTLFALSTRFQWVSVAIGVAAWLTFVFIRTLVASTLSTSSERHPIVLKNVLIPGVLLLMTASSVVNEAHRIWMLPAGFIFVLLSIVARPRAVSQLQHVSRAGVAVS